MLLVICGLPVFLIFSQIIAIMARFSGEKMLFNVDGVF
jgi:hypothetical protein